MTVKSCVTSVVLFAAAVFAFNSAAYATVVSTNSTFYFSGTCSDCTGTGYATLVLQNYIAGTALSSSNFVSFNYTSNVLPDYSLAGDTGIYLSGSIAAATGPDTVGLYGTHAGNLKDEFTTSTTGGWCTGADCFADYGTNGVFSTTNPQPTTPPSSVTPEPATISLLGTGIAGIVAFRRRRR